MDPRLIRGVLHAERQLTMQNFLRYVRISDRSFRSFILARVEHISSTYAVYLSV